MFKIVLNCGKSVANIQTILKHFNKLDAQSAKLQIASEQWYHKLIKTAYSSVGRL